MDSLAIAPLAWDALQKYLDNPVERMAFLAATPTAAATAANGTWTVVDTMYLDDETDYEYQGWAGMELADEIRPRSLQWATRLEAALIEVHSHGAGRSATTFSRADLRGLLDGVPQLVWRLHGRPYGAIVLGGRHDFDALLWRGRTSPPVPIPELVIGTRTVTPTARALERIANLEVLDD